PARPRLRTRGNAGRAPQALVVAADEGGYREPAVARVVGTAGRTGGDKSGLYHAAECGTYSLAHGEEHFLARGRCVVPHVQLDAVRDGHSPPHHRGVVLTRERRC